MDNPCGSQRVETCRVGKCTEQLEVADADDVDLQLGSWGFEQGASTNAQSDPKSLPMPKLEAQLAVVARFVLDKAHLAPARHILYSFRLKSPTREASSIQVLRSANLVLARVWPIPLSPPDNVRSPRPMFPHPK